MQFSFSFPLARQFKNLLSCVRSPVFSLAVQTSLLAGTLNLSLDCSIVCARAFHVVWHSFHDIVICCWCSRYKWQIVTYEGTLWKTDSHSIAFVFVLQVGSVNAASVNSDVSSLQGGNTNFVTTDRSSTNGSKWVLSQFLDGSMAWQYCYCFILIILQ